ncbi:MAG: DUF892 family protein [Bacteroidetes bacterium]|nr:DUF892 family protein [Bacteroidota bacterium]
MKFAGPVVKDAAIFAEIQKALHFKIACYGALKTYAGLLGKDNVEMMIAGILEEYKSADKSFTEIAEQINNEAVTG